jgi:acyl-coenzyme A thioesterase PaaI-like protein
VRKNLRPAGLGCDRFWDHLFEHDFQGFGVATPGMEKEVFAIAFPGAIVEADTMFVIAAMKVDGELAELKAFVFGGVAFGLLDFVDHTAVHNEGSPM